MFIYSQSTGRLTNRMRNDSQTLEHDTFIASGYSGFGDGKNNPAMQNVKDVGPLPCGFYVMKVITGDDGKPCDYKSTLGHVMKAPVIRLIPNASNEMFGRDGLLCHGDSVHTPGTASHGCMIEDHTARLLIADAISCGDDILQVMR